MKRVLLTLAAAVLGAGCVVSSSPPCDTPTLTVDWSFTDADGVSQTCAGMGISAVDVYYDGSFAGEFSCALYGQTFTSAPGSHSLIVEGLDANGTIIARDSFVTSVASCGDTPANAVAGEGWMNLDYHFYPTDQCSGGYMWFAIHDDVANATAALVNGNNYPTRYYCPATIEFPLPYGDYTLQWIQEVANPITSPTVLNQQCADQAFSITAPGLTTVSPTLYAPSGNCY